MSAFLELLQGRTPRRRNHPPHRFVAVSARGSLPPAGEGDGGGGAQAEPPPAACQRGQVAGTFAIFAEFAGMFPDNPALIGEFVRRLHGDRFAEWRAGEDEMNAEEAMDLAAAAWSLSSMGA